MEQVEIAGLNFSYPNSDAAALKNLSLTISAGDFLLLFGRSGCGKSTFLKQLKPSLAPFGKRSGKILFCGQEIGTLSGREQSARIGFVSQDPENQIVTDKVWHELAFGMESLGYDSRTIRLRVAEMASFFGIQDWFFRPVTELSGGQKQILNLASVMVMCPEVLLLDEPTSQLDPIAASNFIQMLRKINEELGVTIVAAEHRLEEMLPVCSRAVLMEQGSIVLDTVPRRLGTEMKNQNSAMTAALPACVRIYSEFEKGETPVTVKEAKQWLKQTVSFRPGESAGSPAAAQAAPAGEKTAVALKEVWFRYGRSGKDVLRGVTLKVRKGIVYSVVGGNGVGKSTLLSVIGGIERPYRGTVTLLGRRLSRIAPGERHQGLVGFLPQEPKNLFRCSTVGKDLEEMALFQGGGRAAAESRLNRIVEFFHLGPLLNRHPYDLSGGEQQCAGLAKVLLTEPQILLLDEPTKGLDAVFKKRLAGLLSAFRKAGKTVLLVSHDLDFCAECSDECALMFQGELLSSGRTREFFTGNAFYTTSANRIARGVFPKALTCEEVIQLCRKNLIVD